MDGQTATDNMAGQCEILIPSNTRYQGTDLAAPACLTTGLINRVTLVCALWPPSTTHWLPSPARQPAYRLYLGAGGVLASLQPVIYVWAGLAVRPHARLLSYAVKTLQPEDHGDKAHLHR